MTTTQSRKTENRSINYGPLAKQGFNEKTCAIHSISIPTLEKSKIINIYPTSSPTPQRYQMVDSRDIVPIQLECIPYGGGEALISKAKELVEGVLKDAYKPEIATITIYKQDGTVDKNIQIQECIIQKVVLKVNRKDEEKGELGYVRIIFHLQGLIAEEK